MEIISKPNPVYTEEARQLRLQGEVLLEVSFGANGQLHVNRVVRGLGHGLDEAAISAANKMRFKPAQHLNQPMDSTAIVHVRFPAGVLSTSREDLSYAYLEMDDHRLPADRVQRDGAADGCTGFDAEAPSRRRSSRELAGRGARRAAAEHSAAGRVSPRPRPSALPPPWTRWWTGPSCASTRSSHFCKTRTPLVETYLQNLKLDQQMGPSPPRTTISSAAWT